jgi:bacteriocin biosynthesis cyclodehydratase domain-containing protein
MAALPSSPTARTSTSLAELTRWRRPRLRDDVPILWRDRSTVQIGDDVVVDRVRPEHVTWLLSLDGLRSPEEVSRELALPREDARRLIRAVIAAGALDDAGRIPDAIRWSAPAERDAQTRRFGATLRTYRDLDAAYAATSRRDDTVIAIMGDGLVRDLVEEAVAGSGLRLGPAADARLVVLADSHHPDVPAHFDHDLQDLPHLHVGVFGERATVGPLVVPGRTGCLRCAHLHRRDADSAWPLLAVQWAQAVATMTHPPADPLLLRLAADHAVLLARSWTDAPDRVDLWADTAIELRLPEGTARRVPRPPHPLCGCRWPAS